jgi:hypothetical protein
MTFLQKKLQETIPEEIYQQILLIEESSLEEFEEFYRDTLRSLTTTQLNTFLDFLIAKKKIQKEIKISFLHKLLSHEALFLREKVILYLEALQQKDCIPTILSLRSDVNISIRAQVYWILAKHTMGDEDLTPQIIEDLKTAEQDNDQILLAAALFQRNDSPSSFEMRFLKEFYLGNYFDSINQVLKISLTGEHGHAAQTIGLILWEASIKIYAIDSLETYNLQWLVEKVDEKISL